LVEDYLLKVGKGKWVTTEEYLGVELGIYGFVKVGES